MARTIVFSLLLILVTIGSARHVTDGFSAFTRESARRLDVSRNPRPVPPTVLLDSDGQEFVIGGPGQPATLVEFIYTSCPTTCVALGAALYRVQSRIASEPGLKGLQLVSISFDLDRDQREQLKSYGQAHGAVAPTWRIARPRSRTDLDRLLAVFEIVVLDDGNGGYVHNTAVHWVDDVGRIVRIVDMEATDGLLSDLGRQR